MPLSASGCLPSLPKPIGPLYSWQNGDLLKTLLKARLLNIVKGHVLAQCILPFVATKMIRMTISAIFLSTEAPFEFWAFSDVLVSNNVEKTYDSSHSAFLRPGDAVTGFGHSKRQKIQIVGQYCLLWSGSVLHARLILRELRRLKKKSPDVVFPEIQGLMKEIQDGLEIMLTHIGDKLSCLLIGDGIYYDTDNGMIFATTGSGSGDVVWEEFGGATITERSGKARSSKAFMGFSQKFGEFLFREFTGATDPEKAYGAGAEVAYWRPGVALKKVNHSTSLFETVGKDLGIVAKSHFTYKDKILYCNSLFSNDASIPETADYTVNLMAVPNIDTSPKIFGQKVGKPIKNWMFSSEMDFGLALRRHDNGVIRGFSFRYMPPGLLRYHISAPEFKVTVGEDWPTYSRAWAAGHSKD